MLKYITFLAIFTFSYAFGQDWEERESLPAVAIIRHHPITFSIGGVGYLVAGTRPGAGVLGDFYSYDKDADSWTTLPDFPGTPRGFSYGVTTDTKGYIGFGIYENEVTFEFFPLNDLWEFDPVTEDWTELAPCPCLERWHPAMVQVNNKIFMGLGSSLFGDLKDWWEYDIDTDTWTELDDFPGTERHHPYFFGIGDFVYVGFGHHASEIFDDFYRYDPATGSWTELSTFPGQGRVAGTQFSYGDKGYVLSGQGETHDNLPTGEFWEYDPTDDSWVELLAHPDGGRWAPGSFLIDGTVFFTCGEANSGEKKDLISFELDPSVGIETVEKDIQIYPNPTNGMVYLQGITASSTPIQLFDTSGRLVLSTTINNNAIDLSLLSKGVYILKIETADYTANERITVN